MKRRSNRGEATYNARLSAAEVEASRAAYRVGGVSVPKLARFHGVTPGAMYCALAGASWPDVPGALGWGFGGRGFKARTPR